MPKTLDVGDQEVAFAPDLFIVPAAVMLDKELQPLDAKVYAVVYWMERLKDGRCYASNATIGKVVAASGGSVANSLTRLRDQGYIQCTYGDNKNRTGIITLVQMRKASSNDEGGVPQMMNIDNKTEKKYTSETLKSVQQCYKAWLIYMRIDPEQRSHATTDVRQQLLNSAAKSYRLTTGRRDAIARRLTDFSEAQVIRAIKNLSQSDFHRGDNDRGWRADLLWLCKSYEKMEEWANKEVQ